MIGVGAFAGYPAMSLPIYYVGGALEPISMIFTGAPNSEAMLISFANIVENAINARVAPGLAYKANLEQVIVAVRNLPEAAFSQIEEIYTQVLAVYNDNLLQQSYIDAATQRLSVALLAIETTTTFADEVVPLRQLAEAQGAAVEWDAETATAIITTTDSNIHHINIAQVGGFIEDGRSFVPCSVFDNIFSEWVDTRNIPGREVVFIEADNPEVRAALWIEDLNQFREAVEYVHPKFNDDSYIFLPYDLFEDEQARFGVWIDLPQNVLRRQNFDDIVEHLIENVNTLSDFEIAMGLTRATVALGDNHFSTEPWQLSSYIRPFQILHLGGDAGGFYVTDAPPEHPEVIHTRMVYINGFSIDEVIGKSSAIFSHENRFGLRNSVVIDLLSINNLYYLGLLNGEYINVGFEDEDGNVTEITFHYTVFVPAVEEYNPELDEDGFEDEPQMPEFNGNHFTFIEDYGILHLHMLNMRLSLFFAPMIEAETQALLDGTEFDFDDFEESFMENPVSLAQLVAWIETGMGLIVPDVNYIEDYIIFNDYMREDLTKVWVPHPHLVEFIQNNEINAILIDARDNPGGDSTQFGWLFQFLAELVDSNNLFYAINDSSASASSLAAMYLKYLGFNIIGEPLAQNAIFYGRDYDLDSAPFAQLVLANSGIDINIPNAMAYLEEPTLGPFGVFGGNLEAFIEANPNFIWYTTMPSIELTVTLSDWLNGNDLVVDFVRSHVRNSLTN